MNNLKKQGVRIGLLIAGFIIYGFIIRFIVKVDTTGGIRLIMIIGGWVLFLFLLVKFIIEIFKAPGKKTDVVMGNPAYSQSAVFENKEKEGRNGRLVIYFVFLVFVGLLATSGNRPANFTNHLAISNAFGGWFWWISLLCFCVGFGGMRKSDRFVGSDIYGDHVSGYIDRGAVKGTNGPSGAVALALAYISVYMIWVMIAHWKLKKQFPDGQDTTLVVMIIIGGIAVVPLYLMLVKMVRSNNKVNWIIGGAWLVFLSIVARL
jgi:hypothetical protein